MGNRFAADLRGAVFFIVAREIDEDDSDRRPNRTSFIIPSRSRQGDRPQKRLRPMQKKPVSAIDDSIMSDATHRGMDTNKK